MKVRIVQVPTERASLYADWIAEAVAEIYGELPLDPERRAAIDRELREASGDPAFLLLVAEVLAPSAGAAAADPTSYSTASLLLTLPRRDGFLNTTEACLRVLFTAPAHRQRGIAASLLRRAEETLASRGLAAITADALYGDDAIVGLFERHGYMRGRMTLTHAFRG